MTFAPRARLLAYTRFVLADYLLMRASVPLVFLGVGAGTYIYVRTHGAPPERFLDPRFILEAHTEYAAFSGILLYLGVFLAVVGVMTVDRTTGYFRFFFSKPVNVVTYYVHAFCVHGVALIGLLGAFAWAYGSLMARESLHRGPVAGALAFALVGGLGMLFGALTRLDAAVTPVLFIAAMSVQQTLADWTVPPRWLVDTGRVLPPALDLERSRAHLLAAQALPPAELWHVLGYGAGAMLLGLLILRRAPLAR